ncbi:PKD domain-containing protein, partial [Hymenobacter daecheongensis]|uniref:PKD domain-containing protein n=1 Tax=Hymenobacter daecheongensis TaxID=496053 RepID=UPI0009339FFE
MRVPWALLLALVWLVPGPALAQVRIMPLGASTTQGDTDHNSYRRPLWQKLQTGGYSVDFVGSQNSNFGGPPPNPDFDLDHEGHWGWRADELLAQAQGWSATHQPDVVLMHAGSNDMIQNQSVTETRDELGQLIDALRAGKPTVKIIMAQLLPVALSPGNSNITALNALLPALAQQKTTAQSPVIIVDQNTGYDPAVDTYDGVHLTPAGEVKMADRWYTAIQTLLGPPTAVFYALTVNISGTGTVSRNPDAASYASGTGVTLTASPGSGQQFTGWSGDVTSMANPLNITMSANRTITATFAPLPTGGQAVTSFTLINADSDQDIQTLANGGTLNLAALPTRNLNLRANTSPAAVGSVRFSLGGAQSRSQTENVVPYALFSDTGGDYNPWTPAVGTYSLTATPYTGGNGTGTPGTPLTISFSVTNQPGGGNVPPVANAGPDKTLTLPTTSTVLNGSGSDDGSVVGFAWSQASGPATATFSSATVAAPTVGALGAGTYVFSLVVTDNLGLASAADQVTVTVNPAPPTGGQAVTSFTLINADSDQPLQTLAAGAVLNLATLPTQNLNLRANTSPAAVGSVVLALSG